MRDRFGRDITYLRVSITDRCNLKCAYCSFGAGYTHARREDILSYEEFLRVIRAGVPLGIRKIRITGGEPLVRADATGFIREVVRTAGVEHVGLTTNGLLLRKHVSELADIGMPGVNVSLDSLKADRFARLTGAGPEALDEVVAGIESTLQAGLKVKVNVVLMRGLNDDELAEFARMSINRPIQVRFIEFMPPGEWSASGCAPVTADEAFREANRLGRLVPVSDDLSTVARVYRFDGAKGTLGFISPYSQPFCAKCNKIRLTAQGVLRSCLLSDAHVDLRALLRTAGATDEQVRDALRSAIALKPEWQKRCRDFSMSDIGG
ncbi:MAG: GTP 3',8-cyclase MoaA [Planctomycetota bacterium]|nr:GTP 3',8-cyclase MoaA [Planctomycetota bacterium]